MTEPRHFHSARKGSGSLRPFPIYPLYTQAEILSLDKPIADCFLFRPRKNRKSAGNAVIPTYPTHCSHGLQYLRYKRPMFAFMRESGYTLGSRRKIAHSGSHGETGAFRTGPLSLPSTRCCTFTNIPGPGIRTAHFAAFGSWPGVRQKDAESLRDSDVLMRVAVPRRRGPAGLRDPVAVPLTALIGFTILLSRIVAHRKLSACSLVTAVRFWNRCSRRSMRGTCPLEQRSDCRF